MHWDKFNPFSIHALQNQGNVGKIRICTESFIFIFLSVSTAQAVQFLVWQNY